MLKPFAASAFLAIGSCLASSMADVPAEQRPFRDFLAQAPNFTSLRFALSGENFMVNGKPFPTAVHFDAAWQEGSFFVRQAKGSGAPDAGNIGGRSRDGTWWYVYGETAGIPVVEVAEEAGSRTPSGGGLPHKKGVELETRIQFFRSLGISFLIPGTLRWLGPDAFEGRSRKGGTVSGKVAGTSGDRISRIEFRDSGTSQILRAVDYTYPSGVGAGLPSQWACQMQADGRWNTIGVYFLESVETGEDPAIGPAGYLPGTVLAKGMAPVLIVNSNGASYEVQGSRLQIIGAKETGVTAMLDRQRRGPWGDARLWMTFLAGNLILGFSLVAQRKMRKV